MVCFVCLVLMYVVANPMGELLQVDWAVLLVDMITSILVVFATLYRSCWHCEITGATRTIEVDPKNWTRG